MSKVRPNGLNSTTQLIGFTSREISRPIFFDPNSAQNSGENFPPGTVVTGMPGRGKTFFLQILGVQGCLVGKRVAIVDYKGEMGSLKNLESEIGPVNLWHIGSEDMSGSMDPFLISGKNTDKITENVKRFIEILIGGWRDNTVESHLSAAIRDEIRYATENRPATMVTLMESLLSRGGAVDGERIRPIDQALLNIGNGLKNASSNPVTKCAFARINRRKPIKRLKLNSLGATVITFDGIDMPKNAEEAAGSSKGRAVSAVFYLVTNYITQSFLSMTNNNVPKMLIIDEAWAMLSSEAGRSLIRSVGLLGRSRNLSYVLSTQEYAHLKDLDISSTISTHIAFGNSDEASKMAVEKMDLPRGEEDIETNVEILKSLGKGEVLMRDASTSPRRFACVQIFTWRKDWAEAFETNPAERARIERERLQREGGVTSDDDFDN